MLSVVVGLLVVGVGAWRISIESGRDVDGASTAVIAGLLVGVCGAAGLAAADDYLHLVATPAVAVGIVVTACGVAVLMRVAERAARRPRRLPLIVLVALATTGVMIATFWAWTEGLVVDYRSATIIALVGAFVGMSASVSVAGAALPPGQPSRARPPVPPSPDLTPSPPSAPGPQPRAPVPPATLPRPRLRSARPPEGGEGIGRSGGAVRGSD